MTSAEHRRWRNDCDTLHQALIDAQDERRLRDDIVETRDETGRIEWTVAWVLHERAVMRDTVNRLRAERGLEPASPDDLRRAEGMATGHSDYASKFAIYCADLVHQTPAVSTDQHPGSTR